MGSASNPNPGFLQYCSADLQSSVSEHVFSPKSITSKNFRSDDILFATKMKLTIFELNFGKYNKNIESINIHDYDLPSKITIRPQ